MDTTPKKRKKMALGKGLGALIPGGEPVGDKEFLFCPIDRIHPNRYQPRREFSDDDLAELSQSIREQGIIQPLIVRNGSDGYELIAGERRLRAARLAGLTRVPVVVKELADAGLLEMSLVENIQRSDLNPLEESDAYHRLMTEFGMTQEEVVQRVGKSRPAVANFLRLRLLPHEIRKTLSDGSISLGHAKVLLGAESASLQKAVWRQVITKGLSVRETENLLQRLKAENVEKNPASPTSEEIYFGSVAENLSRRLGTKVQIRRKGKKGKVLIDFYGDEDLDRLLKLFQLDESAF